MGEVSKRKVINIFLNAGIAYELGGDWRLVFRIASITSIGSTKKLCISWMTKKDEDMDKAIDNFLNG